MRSPYTNFPPDNIKAGPLHTGPQEIRKVRCRIRVYIGRKVNVLQSRFML